MTALSLSPLNLIVRAVVVFVFVLVLLRISGKRQIGQMGATEFVAILLISNAVQNAMNGGDNSLIGGLILAVVLIAASWGISHLTYRSKIMRTLFEGQPRLLVHNGSLLHGALVKERITESEFRTMLRKQGIHTVHEIQTAVLEADGVLSLTKKSDVASA